MGDPPAPLRPATAGLAGPMPLGAWLAAHALGVVALVLGAGAFVAAVLTQDAMWASPDWRLTVPCFVATLVVAALSLVRKEGAPILALGGLGLAAIAMVLGWFLVMAIIVVVTAILVLILSLVM